MPKKLKMALVGCGRVAGKHLQGMRYLQRKGLADLACLVDREEASASALKKASGLPDSLPVYPDLAAALAQESLDVVAITTSSASHRDLAILALDRHCHVLLEKPLALDSEQGRDVALALQESERQLALGHIYRYLPAVQDLQKALEEGQFGRILYASVQMRWGHDQTYYDQAPWRGDPEVGGGVILNQAIHALDLGRWLLGAIDSPVKDCQAKANRLTHHIVGEDFVIGTFEFANGSYLTFEGTTCSQPDRHEARIYLACEEADLRLSMLGKKLQFSVWEKGKERRKRFLCPYLRKLLRREGLSGFKTLTNPHIAIYLDLYQAIREGRPPVADIRAGLSSLEMVEAFYRNCR